VAQKVIIYFNELFLMQIFKTCLLTVQENFGNSIHQYVITQIIFVIH